MVSALVKTFTIAHADDSDEHLAQALVFNAGRMAWRMREAGLQTEQKTSVSDVVTAADRVAEAFVAGVLANVRPEDGILGEEGAARPSTSGRVWVIDPVDGTYNFSTGSDYWCSALALVEGDPDDPSRLIFGAVHRPAMGYTWFGGPEIPTTLDGKAVAGFGSPDSFGHDATNSAPELSGPPCELTCLGGYLHPSDFATPAVCDTWVSVAESFATVRMLGSASVDLGCVSTGQIGCWMQHSVASWDWLPGCALVEGAGGAAERVASGGLEWFVAGSPRAVAQVRRVLREGGAAG
ncbi:inositol monophosphatase family protein [Corynebacterium heidelbergense]|uniref:Inositol monophosphatase n=1 Tax=Corynebacterium heidelbergense TaxID=2055947 RepID=A0A364V3H0_9CORY|nr:inositol monophosphatase family protein [Corynebacterium heidelbergense]RAV31174.1 inositol monophosphatase [Corynebacterium heidelbergense]